MATERRPHPSRRTGGGKPAEPRTTGGRRTPAAPRATGTGGSGRLLRDGRIEPPRSPRPPRHPRPARRPVRLGPSRIPLASVPRRLRVVLLVMAIAMSLCAGRLLQLQGFDSSAYAAASAEQLTRTLPLLPSRGDITDRNGLVMATTEAAVAVTADPLLTTPKATEIASVLAGYLKTDPAALRILLTKPNTRFVYLAKKVPALTYSKIAADLTARKLYGVFRESDPIRTYPGGSVGSTVIGYVDAQGKGMAGLERSMNAELAGVEGREVYERAPNGSRIPLGTSRITPAVNGLNYQLTIDSELQWAAERRIAAQVKQNHADSGFVITMNIKTGEILAMANAPGYDSADPGAGKPADLVNRSISNPYEPGSVEKVLTAAALLDSGTATMDTRVKIPARLESGGRLIKDAFSHGTLHFLMRGVIARSSNIGTMLLTRQMSTKRLRDYLTSFGLGSRTGVELPGESAGILPKETMPDYTRDQIAFGQALAVTGVQEAAAVAGILNGGVYNPPTVIKGVTDAAGHPVPVTRRPSRQVVSAETSLAVRDLMRGVIVDTPGGREKLALEGYHTGGKTGTAQRADESCHCYRGYVTSFAGFAPVEDPKILTYVVVNNPRSADTGTATANPVFKDVMRIALPRYSVAPTTVKLKPKKITYGP